MQNRPDEHSAEGMDFVSRYHEARRHRDVAIAGTLEAIARKLLNRKAPAVTGPDRGEPARPARHA